MNAESTPPRRQRRAFSLAVILALLVASVVTTFVVTYLLVTMFERKQEARVPFARLTEVTEISTHSGPWGLNWPHHFEGWKSTAGDRFYGDASAMPESKLEQQPWLRRLYAGYAFSIDYREARGHAYMLYDQGVTERVHQAKQAGACLHCHASTTVLYRKVGREAMGRPTTDAALASAFDMEAVVRGFEVLSTKPYQEVYAMLREMPDGTGGEVPVFPEAPEGGFRAEEDAQTSSTGSAHPVGCIDCHDPKSMQIRVTRPGFVKGIAALAAGDGDASHLPSVLAWRRSDRKKPYDPNEDATRQEMRSFVCGQCHVEYYCATRDVLEFPWGEGLAVEDLERHWEKKTFSDGTPFSDYDHGETGAKLFKAQHPEFELWSQGVHAKSGVSCADCHMPYERKGAMKISNHGVSSPLKMGARACLTCHARDKEALYGRVAEIQRTTTLLMERAGTAMTEMLDAILEAKAGGATEEALAEVFELQRKSMWRLDYISSENSKGFHAPQEAARILGESIDYSRQATNAALRLRAPDAPSTDSLKKTPVKGVTKDR